MFHPVLSAQEYLKWKRPEEYKRMRETPATDPETGKQTSELVVYAKRQGKEYQEALKREMARLEERKGDALMAQDVSSLKELLVKQYLDPDHI